MANQTFPRAARRFLKSVFRLPRQFLNNLVRWLLRGLLLVGRRPTAPLGGFVLPTTVLLLLVLSLTVGAITLRTYNRTTATIGDRQQRVIYNAATPAIDRAKAKLEFLFNPQLNPRLPGGVPFETDLDGMLRNVDIQYQYKIQRDGNDVDPYTFPDEEATASSFLGLGAAMDVDGNGQADRLDINGDGEPDNAWAYRADIDGDPNTGDASGNDATVVYSIILKLPGDLYDTTDAALDTRAANLEVRHGPLSNSSGANSACSSSGGGSAPIIPGWLPDQASTSISRKNFQVNVLVLPDDDNGTVATLEFHQDRQVKQGNKWGAWFRNDLELFPGPTFNWNGAMHTEGSLIMAGNMNGGRTVTAYLISSPASCFYDAESSEITVADTAPTADNPAGFQGQVIAGAIREEGDASKGFAGKSDYHLHPFEGNADKEELNPDNDSITPDTASQSIINYTLDPVVLFTQDISKARLGNDAEGNALQPADFRDTAWQNTKFVERGRIYNKFEPTPFVDDTFRADDRYGPKATIQGEKIPGKIGERIMSAPALTLNVPGVDDPDAEDVGLDGYWERRARNQGLRVVVGERLELGNAFGWGGGIHPREGEGAYRNDTELEPLLPFEECTANNSTGTLLDKDAGSGRCHEARQRRSLYDNLAAVQAAVFYHAGQSGIASGADDSWRDFPIACMASTVHPGSAESLVNSSAYKNLKTDIADFLAASSIYKDIAGKPPVVSNFFWGYGTNGWEYEPAPHNISDEASFKAAIMTKDANGMYPPLGRALRNLAHFAGDPLGGTPSFTPADNTAAAAEIHPFPQLSMWGDFSMLRRILAMLDGTTAAQGNPLDDGDATTTDTVTYDDLSPADKSTLHSAACTLGMLAYNIGYLERFTYQYDSTDSAVQTALGMTETEINDLNATMMARLMDLEAKLHLIEEEDTTTVPADAWKDDNPPKVPEGYLYVLKRWHILDPASLPASTIALAETIMLKEQITRDRLFGFKADESPNFDGLAGADLLPDGTRLDLSTIGDGGLTHLLTRQPKFPALHYVFPGDIKNNTGATTPNDVVSPLEDKFEEYDNDDVEDIRDDSYIYDVNPITGANVWEYRAIDLKDDAVLDNIAAYPINLSSWVLPHVAAGEGNTMLSNVKDEVMIGCTDDLCGTAPSTNTYRLVKVGFKDAALYNGREMMLARTMDLNLGLMRDSNSGLVANDRWLPLTGIIYAFREDAVREDEINRPAKAGQTWATCGTDVALSGGTANCQMDAGGDALSSTDPPLYDVNFISPKPVDYYPDPDRRPHGFRLRNGETVKRSTDTRGRGMSFVSDNPVYTMGHFNLHKKPSCTTYSPTNDDCNLEEFQPADHLAANWSNFYQRKNLDTNFARAATDDWRPTEILTDAFTVLSTEFCDGSVEDWLLYTNKDADENHFNRYGCTVNSGSNRTSFMNQNQRDKTPTPIKRATDRDKEKTSWQPANPYDFADNYAAKDRDSFPDFPRTPIVIDRNGNPVKITGSWYSDDYKDVLDSRKVPEVSADTRVNAIIISGIVPSRTNQMYGGLHNFPRFNEFWKKDGTKTPLYISGSLLQLSFSKYATGPFDHDTWEPSTAASTAEELPYYDAPDRRWGYDVGLQYAPTSPAAKRFVSTSSSPRSEFYSEPPADDPYIAQLCKAITPDDEEARRCPE